MDKLKTIMAIKKTIKDFQFADRLDSTAKKAEKVVLSIQKVNTKAETINKIVKLNADPADELIVQSNEGKNKALDLNERLVAIFKTQEKLKKGIEMHKLMDKVVTFVEKNRNKVRNDMPKQEILNA